MTHRNGIDKSADIQRFDQPRTHTNRANNVFMAIANRGLTSKLASIFLAAMLALSMMPAIALGADEQDNTANDTTPITELTTVTDELEAVENELVVVYEDDPLEIHELNEGTSEDVEVIDKETIEATTPEGDSIDVVTVSGDTDIDAAIEELTSNPKVASVEPNYIFTKMTASEGALEAAIATASQDQQVAGEEAGENEASSDDAILDPLASLQGNDSDGVDPEAINPEAPDNTAEPDDPTASLLATTNDTNRASQYYLSSSGFLTAWDRVKCDGTVTVVVIDDGCMYEHRDLKANINTTYAYDAVTGKALQSTPVNSAGRNTSHGTNVAGVIAAVANNNQDIAGASYNAKVLPINVFLSNGKAAYSTIMDALYYVESLAKNNQVPNMKVLNMSFGAYDENEIAVAMRNTLQRLRNNYNILPVAAGGNGDDYYRPILKKSYPGDFDVCISVTSLTQSGSNSSWCDYNEYKDISAPGEGIMTTSNSGAYTASVSGTSFSSPIVASAAALVYAANPKLTATQVENALKQTTTRVTGNAHPQSGSKGALNVKAAVDLALSGKAISNTPMARYAEMYRLYNPNSGEHFYTASAFERNHLTTVGWNYEGIGWRAPLVGNAVYRLYNPNGGDHHYTTSAYERDMLVRIGWRSEGIGWYTSVAESQPLFRLYNPNASTGSHHYTLSYAEALHLDAVGWNYEGIGWYGTD